MNINLKRTAVVLAATLLMLLGMLNAALAWTISGTIYNGSNPLANASLTLNDAATSAAVGTTTTNGSGLYSFSVSDGEYNLTITPPAGTGLSQSVVKGITVSGANVTQSAVLVASAVTLSGSVYLPGGTTPIDGVYVWLYDANWNQAWFGQTDSSGAFSAPVAPGSYHVTMEAYDSQTPLDIPGDVRWTPFSNLEVTGSTTLSKVILPVVTLSGKTTDSSGQAVGGVQILQKHLNVDGYTVYSSSKTSDASGNYSFKLIAGSGYEFTLTPPAGSGLGTTQVNNVAVTADTTLDLALPSAAITLSGTVVMPDGTTPVENVYVWLYDSNWHHIWSGTTNASGTFSAPVSSGTYQVTMEAYNSRTVQDIPNDVYWTAARNLNVTSNTQLSIVLPVVTLSGKVTDSNGAGISGVMVSQNYQSVNGFTVYGYSKTTDASGNYSFKLIAGSGYSFTLRPPAGSGLGATTVSGVAVPADTARDFVLPAAATITGAVYMPDGTTPVNGVYVWASDASGYSVWSGETDAQGAFSAPVAPGTYTISMEAYDYRTTPNTPNDLYWTPFQNLAVTGNTTLSDIILPVTTLSGRTTDSNGVAIPGVTVTLRGAWINGYYLYEHSKVSDASGNFTFSLISGTGYNFALLPDSKTGIAAAQIANIDGSVDSKLNLILSVPDRERPVITGPTVSSGNISTTTATIQWRTQEEAKGTVLYGTTTPPGTAVAESEYAKDHSLTLEGLLPGTTYYVRVTAVDRANNEATPSEVISFTTKATADTLAPVFTSGPRAESIDATSATISWTTDESTRGRVSFGLTDAAGTTLIDPNLATAHSVKLTGLTPLTQYYFKVTATDLAGLSTDSAVYSFTTQATADTVAPTIVDGPMAINVGQNSVTIVWTTDEPATSGVSWNVNGANYGLTQDSALVLKHAVTITGLASGTNYNFTVSSKDAAGNGPSLKGGTFITMQLADTSAPFFTTRPIARYLTDTSASIFWRTDEGATSVIYYGTDPNYLDQTDSSPQLLNRESRMLVNLLPGTRYYVKVVATDLSGNSTSADLLSFVTTTQPRNLPPVIVKPAQLAYASDTTAVVSFATDKPCNAMIRYGIYGGALSNQVNSDPWSFGTEHQLAVTNLLPDTSYRVQVRCTDMAGLTVVASAGSPASYFAAAAAASDADPVPAPELSVKTMKTKDVVPPSLTRAAEAASITKSTANITWNTDKISDTKVYVGQRGVGNPHQVGDIEKVTEHSVILTNLAPGTTYEYTVESTDPSNNTTTSTQQSFTTATEPDLAAPVISGTVAEGVSLTRARIAWSTDEQATTQVRYGTIPGSLDLQADVIGLSTTHELTVYNLVPGTTYYFAPVSTDSSGNTAQGTPVSVTLAGAPPVLHTVTASAGAGGSITPATQTVSNGYQLSLAVKPDAGYLVNSITGCGGTLNGYAYTTAAITGNCQVTASFKADPSYNSGEALATLAYPAGGTYPNGTLLSVRLRANRPAASIYYTTDGSTPTEQSNLYSGPITVNGALTLKYFAKDAGATEQLRSSAYIFGTSLPTVASFAGLKNGTTFNVLRSEGGRSFSPVVTNSTDTSYTDNGVLKSNTVYQYAVTSDLDPTQTVFLSMRTPLVNGWNIVAVPFVVPGTAASNVFSPRISPVYEWVPSGASSESGSPLGSYLARTTLEPGRGYFVKAANSSTTVISTGTSGPAGATLTLKPGWTMIANPTTTNKGNIGTNWLIDGNPLAAAIASNKIAGGIYWWNGTTYDSWNIIGDNPNVEPWKGYWILNLDSANHTLTIQ